MFQWAEIRHMHLVAGVPKKEVARRLGLDCRVSRFTDLASRLIRDEKQLTHGSRLTPHFARAQGRCGWGGRRVC